MDLAPRWTPLDVLTDSVIGAVQPVASKAGVDVAVDIPPDFPRLFVDPLRMRQVLFNLVSNAIKFSPAGTSTTIHARTEPGFAIIAIEDHGIGISGEQISRLFHEFEQVHDPQGQTRAVGTGLGLALARHFVELHGGTISVDTKPGKGSVFTIRLPMRKGARRDQVAANGAPPT